MLKTTGRAGRGLFPGHDVLFEGATGETIRLSNCSMNDGTPYHSYRLPVRGHLFYAQGDEGERGSFFDNREAEAPNPADVLKVWYYELIGQRASYLEAEAPDVRATSKIFVSCTNPKNRYERSPTYGAKKARWALARL